jgi:hypothetical protein
MSVGGCEAIPQRGGRGTTGKKEIKENTVEKGLV